ncbi:hypothetical protein PanWU01x14_372020 [Parasponia andersonii]|uniref:DUF4218 domain-containing protein n=1 Tax=Parasponia andersonii TaxID=3476 RepID=A0A2P5A3R9_PARAD|nr:hypothetical protein PanWU01x14_372020 [Parasponia andersonii]
MIHLILHLPKEAIEGGTVYFRWMYSIKRTMGVYKKYVRNRVRPEGSIAEAYVVTEVLTFCSVYLRGVETRFNRPERNEITVDTRPNHILSVFKSVGHPPGKKDIIILNPYDRLKSEWYVMNNCPKVQKYLE